MSSRGTQTPPDSGRPPVDLDAYFARIGYSGPAEPTLATLRALNELHPAAIPFEAIDVILGRGIVAALHRSLRAGLARHGGGSVSRFGAGRPRRS